jgi:hypothetical protein
MTLPPDLPALWLALTPADRDRALRLLDDGEDDDVMAVLEGASGVLGAEATQIPTEAEPPSAASGLAARGISDNNGDCHD